MAKRAVEDGLNVISAPMTSGPTSGLGGCVSVIATGFGRGGLSYGAVALNSIWAMGRRPPWGVAPSGEIEKQLMPAVEPELRTQAVCSSGEYATDTGV